MVEAEDVVVEAESRVVVMNAGVQVTDPAVVQPVVETAMMNPGPAERAAMRN